MRKYFPIYEEAVSHIWLCNCSILNFLIFEENFIFFFYQCRNIQQYFVLKISPNILFFHLELLSFISLENISSDRTNADFPVKLCDSLIVYLRPCANKKNLSSATGRVYIMGRRPLPAVRDLTRDGRWSTYDVSVLKLYNVSFRGKCARMGNTLKLPSPTKLARLGHFPPASQAGRLAGPVFLYMSFLWSISLGQDPDLRALYT